MSNALTLQTVQKNLETIAPQLNQAIPPSIRSVVPAERIIRTLVISCERNPRLLECSMNSLVQAAYSAAVLGLEVDGYTGQAFLVPFNIKGTMTAQLQIGYKGFNTLAARAGYTVNSGVVREGDAFEYELGSKPFIKHTPALSGASSRPILAAWASATPKTGQAICKVVPIDKIMAVKARSMGAKKKDSPWNDPGVGFEAMAEKTAIRRLPRNMPLNVMQVASALDGQGEMGHHAWIDPEEPDSVVVVQDDGSEVFPPGGDDMTDLVEGEQIEFYVIYNPKGDKKTFPSFQIWFQKVKAQCETIPVDALTAFIKWNNENLATMKKGFPREMEILEQVFHVRLGPDWENLTGEKS